MAQTMYAHVNKSIKDNNKKRLRKKFKIATTEKSNTLY
jgi:hypothetical protein